MKAERAAVMEFGFPLNLRPGVVVPVPAPVRSSVVMDQDGFCTWGSPVTGEGNAGLVLLRSEPLPQEFVFHELWDLDLAVNPFGNPTAVEHLLAVALAHGALWRPHPTLTLDLVDRFGAGDARLRTRAEGLVFSRPPVNHIADVHRWLLELQAVAGHLVAVTEDTPTAPSWQEVNPVESEELAHERLRDALDRGLREYRGGAETPMAGSPTAWGELSLDLHAAAMLSIHNLILDDTPIRRCANETCHRPFLRQRRPEGTRIERVRETGVLYCTPRCANTQAQRDRRRRQRDGDRP